MKTNIEDYLKSNRASLDVDEPDDEFIWSGIQSELKPKNNFQWFSWKAAAIILLALVSGFVLNALLHPTPKVVQMTLADISPEYKKQEQFYQASIQEHWDQINMQKIKRSDYTDIFKEMDQLEQLKAESFKDFKELGGNPRLVKTLFEYYEIKIRLLEIMLAEIDKNNNAKNKKHNSSSVLIFFSLLIKSVFNFISFS